MDKFDGGNKGADSRVVLENAVSGLLTKAGCFKVGHFVMKSGKETSSYFDLRVLSAHPEILKEVVGQISYLIKNIDYDVIVTIPTGGMALATALSLQTNKPMGYVRLTKKRYGCLNQLEGIDSLNGKKVLLFDDLIGSGDTCKIVLKKILDCGGVVEDIVVVVDRRLDSKKLFKKRKVHSLLSYKNTYI